jgi:hypothetical protein
LRRSAIDHVGGFEEHFRAELQMYEDQGFLAKIYLSSPVYITSLCLDRYRQHSKSCVATVTKAGKYHLVRRYFLEWLEDYVGQQHAANSAVKFSVERALWPYRHPALAQMSELWQRITCRFSPAVSP